MTDPRPEVQAGLNGAAGGEQPTHVAVPIELWKASIDVLGTLPFAQVENLIPPLRNCAGTAMRLEPQAAPTGE